MTRELDLDRDRRRKDQGLDLSVEMGKDRNLDRAAMRRGVIGKRGLALAVGLGFVLTVSASLAPARSQDPAAPGTAAAPAPATDDPAPPAQDKSKAKAKSGGKAAPAKTPKAKRETPPAATETPAPTAAAAAEAAPDTPDTKIELPPFGFSIVPRTADELWEVIEYQLRTREPGKAAPYLRKFVAVKPDDSALLRLLDEYGIGSFLRLDDSPATRPFAKEIIDRVNEASIRHANNSARIDREVSALTKSAEERSLAIENLRPAGSYAIPSLVTAFRNAKGDARRAIAESLGKLDTNAVPGLIAWLDSSDEAESQAAAEALGRIGDRRAIPPLTWVAADPKSKPKAKAAAAEAIARITHEPFANQAQSPSRLLAAEARRYQLQNVDLSQSATLWLWDDSTKLPVVKSLPRAAVIDLIGTRFAKESLVLDPSDEEAQITLVSLTLDLSKPPAIPPSVLAAGPGVLGQVVRRSIADRRPDLAVKAVVAFGKVSSRDTLSKGWRGNALIEALAAPDRRVQFAAAEALLALDPKAPFPGSSTVVPVLARFAANPKQPGAVVIDGNPNRGSQLVGLLMPLGYDPQYAHTGEAGFRVASDLANVELIVINPSYLGGAWTLQDTLANLRGDARTASLPIFLVGPINLESRIGGKAANFSGIHYLVLPTETALLKRQVDRGLAKHGTSPLSDAERADYALRASQLLTKINATKGSPFAADLATIEPHLVLALNQEATAEAAALALADLPGQDAQRGLAGVLLDMAKPTGIRLKAAESLARNLRRHGPLLSADQEVKLSRMLDEETDPALSSALATVIGALKPKPAAIGRRLSAGFSTSTSTTTK